MCIRDSYNLDEIIPKLKAYTTGNVVDKVTCTEKKVLKGQGKRAVSYTHLDVYKRQLQRM